jgi:hypothetical protein
MLYPVRGRLWLGGLIGVLAAGCGDGGTGGGPKEGPDTNGDPDAGKPEKPDPKQEVDASQPGNEPEQKSFVEACQAACEGQAECLQLSSSTCASDCQAQASKLASSCEDEATAEQNCLADLTCEQARAYALEGHRQHPVCGQVATAYFNACTLDGGQVPQACTDLCQRFEACDASPLSVPACEERCTWQATSFQQTSAACRDALMAFDACAATAECGEVKELAETSLSPVACNDELDAMDAACGT